LGTKIPKNPSNHVLAGNLRRIEQAEKFQQINN